MATINLAGATRTTVIVTTSNINTHHDRIRAFDQIVGVFFDALPIVSLSVTPTGNMREWLYEFEHEDGRTWTQVLKVPVAGDVTMTFDVPDFWELDDFVYHRPVRDQIVIMLAEDTTSISVLKV